MSTDQINCELELRYFCEVRGQEVLHYYRVESRPGNLEGRILSLGPLVERGIVDIQDILILCHGH